MLSTGVKVFLLFSMLAAIQCRSYGQKLETIRSLETSNQECRDKGQNMLRCTIVFYIEMDSILHVAYSSLSKRLTAGEIEVLKREEREWVKKKDTYFKKHVSEVEVQVDAKKSEWGEIGYQVLYADEADFIKERAIELIKRLNKQA
jgi:hypothetical protein